MKRYILYSLSGLAALSAHSQNTSNENVSPNILLIVVDDMGFSDRFFPAMASSIQLKSLD